MSSDARSESTFTLADPIIRADINTSSQIVLTVCERENPDNGVSVSLDLEQANEAADKLWDAAHDLQNRQSNKSWQRLIDRGL